MQQPGVATLPDPQAALFCCSFGPLPGFPWNSSLHPEISSGPLWKAQWSNPAPAQPCGSLAYATDLGHDKPVDCCCWKQPQPGTDPPLPMSFELPATAGLGAVS